MPSTSSWPLAHRFRSPAPLLAVLDTGLRLGSRPLPLQSRAPRCHRDALSLEGALECGAMQRFRVAFKFKTALRVNFLLCPRVSLRKCLEVAPRSAPRMRFNVGACSLATVLARQSRLHFCRLLSLGGQPENEIQLGRRKVWCHCEAPTQNQGKRSTRNHV